jgi:hypothetical protein
LYTEATLGVNCDVVGSAMAEQIAVNHATNPKGSNHTNNNGKFYKDRFHNNASVPEHYQGVVATVPFDTVPSNVDIEKSIKKEVMMAIHERGQRQTVSVKNRV